MGPLSFSVTIYTGDVKDRRQLVTNTLRRQFEVRIVCNIMGPLSFSVILPYTLEMLRIIGDWFCFAASICAERLGRMITGWLCILPIMKLLSCHWRLSSRKVCGSSLVDVRRCVEDVLDSWCRRCDILYQAYDTHSQWHLRGTVCDIV